MIRLLSLSLPSWSVCVCVCVCIVRGVLLWRYCRKRRCLPARSRESILPIECSNWQNTRDYAWALWKLISARVSVPPRLGVYFFSVCWSRLFISGLLALKALFTGFLWELKLALKRCFVSIVNKEIRVQKNDYFLCDKIIVTLCEITRGSF